jgi:hypothetical protein
MSQIKTEMPVSHRIGVLQRCRIEQVVDIHLQAFPNFFLSFLGPRFLREFYAFFLVDPLGIGFGACSPSCEVTWARWRVRSIHRVSSSGFFSGGGGAIACPVRVL